MHCALIMGKARVAPLKRPTIPRMELTAATVATKMDLMLRRELQLELKPSVYWTDSTAVLKYLRNESTRFRTFVANRVTTILKGSSIGQWNHVDTASNPADCASRGQKVYTFLQNEKWISGPEFLYQFPEEWPKNKDQMMISADDPEIKRSVLVNSIQTQHSNNSVRQLMNNFSSWIKLSIAWILKFKSMLLELVQKRKIFTAETPANSTRVDKRMTDIKAKWKGIHISVDDLKEAELEIVKFCQGEKFAEEISALQSGQAIKRGSSIYRLNPQLHNEV